MSEVAAPLGALPHLGAGHGVAAPRELAHPACSRCAHVHRVTDRQTDAKSKVIAVTYDEACPCGCLASGRDYEHVPALHIFNDHAGAFDRLDIMGLRHAIPAGSVVQGRSLRGGWLGGLVRAGVLVNEQWSA